MKKEKSESKIKLVAGSYYAASYRGQHISKVTSEFESHLPMERPKKKPQF
jgi:hypothetical protein